MARPKNPSAPLKLELARVARRIVCDDGADALTMRAAADAAGVSPNAPAFHYPGGAHELLAAVAVGGFGDLRRELDRPPLARDPVAHIRALVERYVEFGVRNPKLYRAMFHARLIDGLVESEKNNETDGTFAGLREIKEAAYQDLLAPLTQLRRRDALRGDEPREAPGLALAALPHGLVGEFIDEGLVPPGNDADPWTDDRRAMTREVIDVLLLGLLADVTPLRDVAGELVQGSLAPEDDPSWRFYRETILVFFPGEHPIPVDLHSSLSVDVAERLQNRGLPDSFAVITAFNPRGHVSGAEENRRRDKALKERLRCSGQMWAPVDGVSPDGRHRETGIAAALSKEESRRLACELEQSAFYWFDAAGCWLVGALVDSADRLLAATES